MGKYELTKKIKNTKIKKTLNQPLEDIYYDTSNPVSYAGARNILRVYPGSKPEIINFLNSQDSYTLHKPVRRKFPRLHYNVTGRDTVWEIDLADSRSLQAENDAVAFLLVVIDVLSKYLWIEPLQNKTGDEVCKGFERIF